MFFFIFVYSSKLVDIKKLVDLLRGYLERVFFQWIFTFLMFFVSFGLISLEKKVENSFKK